MFQKFYKLLQVFYIHFILYVTLYNLYYSWDLKDQDSNKYKNIDIETYLS